MFCLGFILEVTSNGVSLSQEMLSEPCGRGRPKVKHELHPFELFPQSRKQVFFL